MSTPTFTPGATIAGGLTVSQNTLTIGNDVAATGSKFSFLSKRYQIANDSGLGDAVNTGLGVSGTVDSINVSRTVVNVTSSFFSQTTDYYADWWIKIVNGVATDQVRQIESSVYDNLNLYTTLTLKTALTTDPGTANVRIYNGNYLGFIYDPTTDIINASTSVVAADAVYDSSTSSTSMRMNSLYLSGTGSLTTPKIQMTTSDDTSKTITMTSGLAGTASVNYTLSGKYTTGYEMVVGSQTSFSSDYQTGGGASLITGYSHYISRIQNLVTITWPTAGAFTAAGNTIVQTVTAISSTFRPAVTMNFAVIVQTGSVGVLGRVTVGSDGILKIYCAPNTTGTTWTASASILPMSVSYLLAAP